MREIKFRAFFDKYKRMIERIYLLPENIILVKFNSNGFYEKLYLLDDIHIMQYTGLKDKNGKEIYEGDIVLDTYTKQLLTVVFRDGEWRIENEDYDEALYDAGIEKEVVGNIYEEIGKVKGV